MNDTMKAAVLHGAKDLRVEDFGFPAVGDGMVLVRVKRVGICGSDLHYYEHGYCGSFIPSRPFILGHELTGEIIATNNDSSTTLKVGSRITVNPARACGSCEFCKAGRRNLCRNTVMLGSGSTTPPTNGAMAEYIAVRADQCHLLPENFDDGFGAMMEPLAVCLHAVKRSGNVAGKTILVTGAGTIGLLTALTAKSLGSKLVAVSDPVNERRQSARRFGVDLVLNPVDKNMADEARNMIPGGFDIIFEASGAPAALTQAFKLVKPGGTIVQIGTLGVEAVPLPGNEIMVKELQVLGSFRYGDVFDDAIKLVASGKIDLRGFITGVLPFSDVTRAMHIAAGKVHVLKVQLEL